MLRREEWLDLARQLDWDWSYVREQEAFPEAQAGRPWLPASAWSDWEEPYRSTYAEYVATHHAELEPRVYVVPESIDAEVARLKLAALGIELEPMTPEQAAYVASWQHGT